TAATMSTRGGRGGRGRGRGGNASSSDAQDAIAPVQSDAPAEDVLQSLFANLPQDLQPRLRKWAEGVQEAHSQSTTRLRTVAPGPTEQEYNALIALANDPLWTADDTAQLDADCAQLKQVIHSAGANTYVQALWKLTPKFMGCVPISIICPDRLLEYSSEHPPIQVGNHAVIYPYWSTKFCEHLRHLVVHPIFCRSPGLLALAIQYAVKCRTNDRRRWPIQDPTGDRYITSLVSAFRDGHDQTKNEDIHRGVRQQMEVLPPLCHLLREIERVSIPRVLPEAVVGNSQPFAAYRVTTSDVHNVLKAVDQVATCGMTDYQPAELRLMWTSSAIHGHPYPPNNRLKEVMFQACKRQVQEAELRRRRPAVSEAAPQPEQYAQPAEDTRQLLATIAGLQEELRQAHAIDPRLTAQEKLAELERELAEARVAAAGREQLLNLQIMELERQKQGAEARALTAERKLDEVEKQKEDAERKLGELEQKLTENEVASSSILTQIEHNARLREQELTAQLAQLEARATAAEDRLAEA
ncbi:hypothetical protein QBC45DRAFT_310106, partial [Copromyces sp. CBS 386.78]